MGRSCCRTAVGVAKTKIVAENHRPTASHRPTQIVHNEQHDRAYSEASRFIQEAGSLPLIMWRNVLERVRTKVSRASRVG